MDDNTTKQPQLPEGWTDLRKAKASASTGWTYYTELVKVLYEELDKEKASDICGKLARRLAKKFIQPGMKKFGIEGNDPWALASYFKLATGDILGYKVELIQVSPKKVLYRLYPPCVWFPDLDICPEYCHAEGEFEKEAARLINPNIKVTTTNLLTKGNPYCEEMFEEVDSE